MAETITLIDVDDEKGLCSTGRYPETPPETITEEVVSSVTLIDVDAPIGECADEDKDKGLRFDFLGRWDTGHKYDVPLD